jgi:hypothetical protein
LIGKNRALVAICENITRHIMELKEPPDPRRQQILPVVTYSVGRRIAAGKPDYCDHATLLELAVLAKDEARATDAQWQRL